ncbi:hypothetical protein [Kamptonema sp. UHCC 0994]|uniref:hypothetical protein n=1 Tax=Kamptonema sp. UHCC 0994 TaxID=3031329 RepID=UPI0023B8ECFA|nr:hypothetical protein [Kamptonema sp. UHCC 0994]MDF0555127.1 hypothetical protein [Kamptonema sp. UHCC 0994]
MTTFLSIIWLNTLSLLLVVISIILTKSSGLEVSDLFFHPLFYPQPNVAFLTRTFQLLCCVPVIVCAFSYGLLKTFNPPNSEKEFILASAIVTGGFMLNEIYRIHIYLVGMGISKLGVSLFYALVLFSYGWFFRRQLKSTPYGLLLAGVGLLFFAIAVDSQHLKNKITSSLLEGVPKLFSEINIVFYYWCVCKYSVEKSLSRIIKA